MNLHDFIYDRINKINAERVSRGDYPLTYYNILGFFNKYSLITRDYLLVEGEYRDLYQRLIVGSARIDTYKDIVIWQNQRVGYIIDVRSRNQIYVHKSMLRFTKCAAN